MRKQASKEKKTLKDLYYNKPEPLRRYNFGLNYTNVTLD
jgi:hypothetical protein